MQIRFNTDHDQQHPEAFTEQVRSKLASALDRFSEHITRVDVNLKDDEKSSHDDKRCVMEVRLEGRQPVVVTYLAASRDMAIEGATDELARLVEHTLARDVHIDRKRH